MPLVPGLPGFCHDPLLETSVHWPPKETGDYLAELITTWQPDIIHTLGINPASYFFLDTLKRHGLKGIGKWIVQARGGPDLELNRLQTFHRKRIQDVFMECDGFIADNEKNYQNALELGIEPSRCAPFGRVPGTGGLDFDKLANLRQGKPSTRERLIVWPKAYECPQSKALPVFEALCIAAEKITQPFHIFMLASIPETRAWFAALPIRIKNVSSIMERVPRSEVLSLMGRSRVMLAPSILDGIPNSLLEAMALGTFPIVSPLETITPVVKNKINVLFARNLYPQEIAEALVNAMEDDELVDNAAEKNFELVKSIADKHIIKKKITTFYKSFKNESEITCQFPPPSLASL